MAIYQLLNIIICLLILVCTNLFSTLPIMAGSDSGPISKTSIIYKKKDIYAAFPNLFTAADGTLVVTFTTRTASSHYDTIGGTKTLVSHDKGNTWLESGIKYINPDYITKNGSYVSPIVNGWKSLDPLSADQAKKTGIDVHTSGNKQFTATGAHIQLSTDQGKNWKRQNIDLPSHALLMNYNESSYLRTKSNIRLLATYGKLKFNDSDTVFLFRSIDDGKTWQFHPMYPGLRFNEGFNETALVETEEGSIVAIMRPNPDSIGYLYTSVSKDGGVIWSKPRKTNIWGYPANAIRLQDGRIFITYGYRKSPMGIRGGILNEDFSGLKGSEIIIRDDAKGSIANVGYPMSAITKGTQVLIVYYITGADAITYIASSTIDLQK